jgi:hypothetical protein
MKKVGRIVPFVIIIVVVCFLLYKDLVSSVKLTPPTSLPSFGVVYLYRYSWTNLTQEASINKEIEDDIKSIKSAGFDSLKISFEMRQDNLAANKVTISAAKNGLYPIGLLVGHNEKPKDRAFTEDELNEWETFVRNQVKKTKDTIFYWEVWNEPSMTELRFRYGTPSEFIELLKRTRKIINEENPLAKVLVTSDYSDAQSEIFTEEFLNLGGAAYFDYLSFHPYNALGSDPKYTLSETILQEKELSKHYNKPLWITEIGIPDSEVDEVVQAEIALTLFQIAYENNIPIFWFHWSDQRMMSIDGKTGWGLLRSDASFKPSFERIRQFILDSDFP